MKLTLLLLAPLAAYASNTTAAAGNGTAATTAAAAGNVTAVSTAAASKAAAGSTAAASKAPAAATKAAAAATKAPAAAATKAGNTTVAAATDKKVKIAIPAVKVSIDFSVVNTAPLKKAAATAVYDGVMSMLKPGGALFAKFDTQFGAAGTLPGTTGYDTARRLAAHMKETVNDFKYVVTVPAAEHAATMTEAKAGLLTITAKVVGDAIKAQFTAKGNLGNVTVAFDPAGMAVSDPAAGTGSTSGAAAVTGFAAIVFTGLYSLF